MKMSKKSLRFTSALLSTLLISCLTVQLSSAAEIPARFEFRGAGYGHGVGMSQIGAYGQALEGKSGTEIASYYYPGTTVAAVDDSQFVRVNIADKVATVGFSVEAVAGAPAPMLVYKGDLPPEVPATDAPIAQVSGGGELIFSALSGTLISSLVDPLTKESTTLPSERTWTLRWSGTPSYPGEINIVKMRQGSVVRKYKYGQIQVKFMPPTSPAIQGSIIATTTLRIHSEYLRGIGEVPSSWPSAALEAQVITARSFALSKAGIYRKNCDCNLYSSIQDQNFVGYSKESEPVYGQKWIDAISATEPEVRKGLAVMFKGKVVTTFYASSTGGMTQDVAEVWGSSIPYLTPVPDPWSLNPTLNPSFSAWVRQVTQSEFAKAFKLPDVVRYEITARTKAGGVKTVVAFSANGTSSELSGERFRSLLKLPSTWISRSVNRVSATSADSMAISVARTLWPKAKSAVLVNFEQDPASAVIGIAYGNQFQLPVFNVTKRDVSAETAKELARRKITSVILIGRGEQLPTKSALTKRKLAQLRYEGRDEIEVSEKIIKISPGDPLILIASESRQMIDDAARLIASNRPIVWSANYQPSQSLQSTLEERAVSGIFYGEIAEFKFPTRIVVTRSTLTSLIASSWQSPVLIADDSQSEVDSARKLIETFPNIASITVADRDLSLTPFRNLS
jgi:SpoIID/LytB domain protein